MKATIKTILPAICVVLMFALTGCTKSNEDLIIGSWQSTRYIGSYSVSGYSDEALNIKETWDEAPEGSVILTFRDDNTVTSKQTFDDETFTVNATYSIEGDKLTIKYPYGDWASEVFTIAKLDKKELHLYSKEEGSEMDEDELISFSYEETIILKKI